MHILKKYLFIKIFTKSTKYSYFFIFCLISFLSDITLNLYYSQKSMQNLQQKKNRKMALLKEKMHFKINFCIKNEQKVQIMHIY